MLPGFVRHPKVKPKMHSSAKVPTQEDILDTPSRRGIPGPRSDGRRWSFLRDVRLSFMSPLSMPRLACQSVQSWNTDGLTETAQDPFGQRCLSRLSSSSLSRYHHVLLANFQFCCDQTTPENTDNRYNRQSPPMPVVCFRPTHSATFSDALTGGYPAQSDQHRNLGHKSTSIPLWVV